MHTVFGSVVSVNNLGNAEAVASDDGNVAADPADIELREIVLNSAVENTVFICAVVIISASAEVHDASRKRRTGKQHGQHQYSLFHNIPPKNEAHGKTVRR